MYNSIRPGQVWLDTDGKPIQAHGFSVFWNEQEKLWYWYGENKEFTKKGGTTWTWGIRYYTSKDLCNWDDRGLLIPPSEDLHEPLHPTYCIDRPHIIFCEKTGKYVCWIKVMAGEIAQFMIVMQADRWMPQWYIKPMAKSIQSGMQRHFKDYKPDTEPKEIRSVPGTLQKHNENTFQSRYVWLPIEWEGDKPVIRWQKEWRPEELK